MITRRPSDERGHASHGWLDSHFTFSFAHYYDPDHMGFRDLRVINEDVVKPATGFATHPHNDMEIITYILSGELEHRDSMGFRSVIRPGDVQRITAGTGITHSEKNPSHTEAVHLLQIWILPDRQGHTPDYAEAHFSEDERSGTLRLVASHDGRDGSIPINQATDLYASLLPAGGRLEHTLAEQRHAWLQVARGSVALNGIELAEGDGAAISEEPALEIVAHEDAEFLLFDLA